MFYEMLIRFSGLGTLNLNAG